jgi:glycosyltransferase involved in cell wall biosynthesis
MPVYNAEKYLKEAVSSILRQSFSNFEFIINDGST